MKRFGNILNKEVMNKMIVFVLLTLFATTAWTQRKDNNLSKRQTFYYDPSTKTRVESTGYYYVDDLGETTERHGVWTYYNKRGEKMEERTYNRNKLHGETKRFYNQGGIKDLGYFNNDVQDSLYVSFFITGDTSEVGFYDGGVPVDVWRYFYPDGHLKSVEEIKDNISYIWEFYGADPLHTHLVKEGTGEMIDYYGNGNLKSWYNYENGVKNGDFEEASVYGFITVQGSFKDNQPEGRWEHYFITGELEKVVNYKDGLMNGEFINYYDNKEVRVKGEFEAGKKTGMWTWYTNSGIVDMEGTFKNDEQHGKWIYNYPDGKISYRAKYKDGKKDGKWTYYYQMGKKFKEVNFKDDMKHGNSKTWYENGTLLMDGDYVKDKEQGTWKNYWENGQLKNQSDFKDGELDGVWLSFYDTGTPLTVGKYDNGHKVGEWIDYFANGQLSDINTFKVFNKKSKVKHGSMSGRESTLSVKHGKQVTYSQKDFSKTEEGKYKNGKKTGKWITYHPGGEVPAVIANYKDGKLHGKMETFEFLGNAKISSVEYKDGVKHGKTLLYDKHGKVMREMRFLEGIQVIEGTKSGSTHFSPGK